MAAAADLSPLTEKISSLYEEESGQAVRFVVGSSGLLARQIEQGAPFDVYLSANARYVEDLMRKGKVAPDSVSVYALGRLGIWWKGGEIREAKELLRPGIRAIAIANPAHAPYGEAARDYLQRAGVWNQVEAKLVFGENVRQAAQFTASGNADALVSSWTLVRPMKGSLVPSDAHAPIRQAGGVVAASSRAGEARRFLQILGKPAARALFQEHGFDLPE
ncbi:MAG: molybdate ABC transporter substrate-binding protein [Bryobacterales bacterium]|nr:molybdate ABC transporter substrate-binding protein [Bryobacterales bacterium]